MSRVYDRWEKLVDAVLRREKDRHLALCLSLSSSSSADLSSRCSLSSNPFVEAQLPHGLSFRFGTTGEFEVICKAFGFSGIHDFAISPEEYEAMKVVSSSSSSSSSGMISKKLQPLYQEIEVDRDDSLKFRNGNGYFGAIDVIHRKMEDLSVGNGNLGYSCGVASKELGESCDYGYANRCREGLKNGTTTSVNDKLIVRSKVVRRNGIKGVRPTIVVPAWDTSEGFLVDRDPCIPKVQSRFSSSISSNERYGCVINDWQKGDLLGRGRFGSVYEGISDGGFFFAVKEVSLLDQEEEGKQCIIQLGQEIALLSQFEHENIVRYYGTEKDGSFLYIFLELVSQGSLSRLYGKYDLRVSQVSGYTRQILHGLKYLHDRNVIHRDIKCANILVHANGLVKLADFGLAKAAKLNDVMSFKGTAFWMAPEVVRSKGYGLAADIWSLGCTVLEMLTRRFPYFGLEHMSALYKIGQGERPDIPDTLSSDARDFILQCLQVDPNLRPTAAQLLNHPFVKRPLPSSSR